MIRSERHIIPPDPSIARTVATVVRRRGQKLGLGGMFWSRGGTAVWRMEPQEDPSTLTQKTDLSRLSGLKEALGGGDRVLRHELLFPLFLCLSSRVPRVLLENRV